MLREEREVLNVITAEELFDMLNVDGISDNPFESEEDSKLFSVFLKKYIKPFMKDDEQYDEAYSELVEFLECEEKNAFVVGFNTAISLILGKNEINDEGE